MRRSRAEREMTTRVVTPVHGASHSLRRLPTALLNATAQSRSGLTRAAIPTYWVINLVDRQVEVFTEPTGPGPGPDFQRSEIRRESDSISVRVDDREIGPIAVRDLLPQTSPSTPLLPK